MLPASHAAPINHLPADSLHSPRLLADAFSEFISASSLLEASYRDLQREVAQLGCELAERNAALTRSLAENDRMRAALQQMIDSMPCGVLVIDAAGAIVMINPEGRRLLDLGDARVKSLRELSRISQVDFASLAPPAPTRASSADLDHEVCIASPAGKRWLAIGNRILSGAAPGQAPAGERTPLQSIWILRDITAGKQAEQEREAARNATALAEISTILAHEIRNPLASLELFAGLLAEDRAADAGETQQWISHLRAGIRTLSGTVNNVLSMNSGGRPHLAPLNLSSCVKEGVDFVQPIAQQAGVSLSFLDADSDLSGGELIIDGNEDAIRQIVLNLICNAIRHTRAGGAVTVSTRAIARDRRRLAGVEIADTGCGIAPEMMEHLFEAGFSANGDTPGLGLAVCRRLMHQHGGEIRVASRLNVGTTFQLEFPTL
jgi:two-component system sensor histidine kinase FlrB